MSVYKKKNGQMVPVSGGGAGGASYYGVCSTAASTAAKTVDTESADFELEVGKSVVVKFTNGNTASNPTLNVDGTGATPIYLNGSAISEDLEENGTYLFMYNGTQFDLVGGAGSGGTSIVQIPAVTGTSFTYNGSEQGPTITGMDSSKVNVTGATATNAGSYTITFSLKDTSKSVWSDMTIEDKTVSWSIAKANQSFTLSTNAVALNATTLSTTVTVSNVVGDGTMSVASSDTSVATASISNNTITINSVNNKSGSATITVSKAGNNNYNAATNKTITATCAFSKTYTLQLDLTNNDPTSWGTWTDDAANGGITEISPGGGENEVDTFMGYYPCILSNGIESKKINPNDYTKYIDGTSVSTSDGDVMVKFPSRGYKLSISGTTLTVSITDEENKSGYIYPTYKGSAVEAFYHSAYEGYNSSGKLRSWSGQTPTVNQTIGTFRTQAQANGTGYEQRTYYELIYLQCCALIKYKGKNMQIALGRGYVNGNSAAHATGTQNTAGLNYGETTGKYGCKLFGIEDFWGNVWDFVDGIFSDSSRNILTADGNFNDTGSRYINQGSSGFTSDAGGYFSRPKATTTKMGFVPDFSYYNSGSATTFFCDNAAVNASRLADFGGAWNGGDNAGLFRLNVNLSASTSDASCGGRLTYFKVAS